jgi:hypothetical protein
MSKHLAQALSSTAAQEVTLDTKALFYSHSGNAMVRTSCRMTVHEVMLLCAVMLVSSAHLCRSLSQPMLLAKQLAKSG